MSQGNLPSSVGKQCESTKRNPARVRIFESRGKSSLEWVEYNAKQVPGPGAYSPTIERPSTGKFSTARPIGYLDIAINKGKREPGPLEYQARDLGSAVNKPGGRFSTSFPKTFIELECYRAKSIPGPKYVTPIAPVAGLFGRISEARPKSAVDWLVYDAKQKPSPCDYVVKGKTRVDCSPASGGGFGKGKSKGFIELEELRTSDHPAPGDYIINRLGVYAIRPKVKEPKRTYCSRDRMSNQLQALEQMSRKKVLTKAERKERKAKRQRKRMARIRKEAKERARVRAMKEAGVTDTAMAMARRPEAMFSSRKLLRYKIAKLDDTYRRYM
jgi:hypothetical protein